MSAPSVSPLTGERRVLAEAQWPTTRFFTATQDISRGVVWSISNEIDTMVIHLGGPITKLETELDGCGSALEPPMPGEIWIIPAGQRYCSQARGGVVRYAELHMDRSIVNNIVGKDLVTQPIRARAGHFDSFFHRAILHLEFLAGRSDDLSFMAAESLAQSLLFDFYSRYGATSPEPIGHQLRLNVTEKRLTEQYIADFLGEPLRLNALAALNKMTAHEFLIAFRASFGTTPMQYVIEQRLRRARFLLLNTPKTLAAIAMETGFSSHAHLTSTFQRKLGLTPQEFRRAQRTS